MRALTKWEYDVLSHASSNGRYVTGDQPVIALAAEGLLRDDGPQRLAAGDHYLTVTPKGREALNAYRAALPKPAPVKKRRRSAAFEAWRSYREVYRDSGFGDFWKNVWPEYQRRSWA